MNDPKKFDALIQRLKKADDNSFSAASLSWDLDRSYPELSPLFENISDALFIVDRNWKVKLFNAQAERLLGRPKEEILGNDIWLCYPEEAGKSAHRSFTKAFDSGLPVHAEEYLRRLNRWFSFSAFPSEDCLVIFFRDITEEKEKSLHLSLATERYNVVAKATGEAIWDWIAGKKEIYWHGENFQSLFGYPVMDAACSYELWVKNIHETDRKRVVDLQWSTIENGGSSWSSQYWFKKADGTYAYVHDRALIIRDESGRATRMIGSMADITSKKRAEDALKESEERYKLLFNSAPLPQFIFNVESKRMLNVNKAALKIYGYTIEDGTSLTAYDLRPADEHHQLDEYIAKLQNGEQEITAVTRHIKKGGELMDVEVTATIITYDNKSCVLGTIKDITETKLLEKKMARLHQRKQLHLISTSIACQEAANLKLGKQLQHNLSDIAATARLLYEAVGNKQGDQMDKAATSFQQLCDRINELQLHSRSLTHETISGCGLRYSLDELMETHRKTHQQQIHFIHEGTLENIPLEIKQSIFRIVQEQLDNIVRHAAATQVNLRLVVNDTYIGLLIKDNGKGFNVMEERNGVGLTNILHRTKIHNGSVKIQSAKGNGCWLKVTFPLTTLK